MLGGKVGDEELEIQGAPKFAVGDEDILFVRGNGRQFYPLVAIMHGRYPIKRHPQTGREFLARSNGEPLTSETDVSKPMAERSTSGPRVQAAQITPSALTPAEFSSRIRASIERGKLSQRAK